MKETTCKTIKDIDIHETSISKPILKWVGGKTQIINKIINEFPIEINNFHDIFLGGSSVLLALLSYVKNGFIKINGKVYAYDLNEPLIYTYKNIQTNHNILFNEIQKIIIEFNSCGDGTINRKPTDINEAKIAKENYYYWIRSKYNELNDADKKSVTGSAMFIFLNKTCFRGIFRVGPNGFNVPYGHYKNPKIIDKEHLNEIKELIKDVIFESCDFNKSLNKIESNDYVYLDPPYAPETNNSFVGYTKDGFDIDNHINLFKLIHKLTENDKKIMLSNADVKLVRENFENKKYNINSILCKRAINSKNPDAKAKEVIITNY
jgi:DNA adenine methylase